jgi:hypothetical protein
MKFGSRVKGERDKGNAEWKRTRSVRREEMQNGEQ